MKKLIYALTGVIVLCAGCSDDVVNKTSPVRQGDPIAFGASTGYETESPTTRTVYTDEFYTENGKNYERVDWVPDTDKIRIYCEQASNPYEGAGQFADYLVTANNDTYKDDDTTTPGQNRYAALQSTGTYGALQWGNVGTEHHFYAVYPAPEMFDDNSSASVSIEKNIVKGVMPTNQQPKSIAKKTVYYYNSNGSKTSGEEMYVCEPDMRYAFLTAHTAVTPQSATSNELLLSFHSIATALELELQCPSTRINGIKLTDVRLSTTNTDNPLCGQFVADLTKVSSDRENPYPTMTMGDAQYSQNTIDLSLMHDENGTQVPLSLKAGEKVQLTLFMLPVNDLSNLQLTVQTAEGSSTADLSKLNNSDVVLKAHLKHVFRNVSLPNKIEHNQWVGQHDDDVILSQLSIPGTGASYTYDVDGDGKAQVKTIEEQFNMGIRAFEITTFPSGSSFADYKVVLDNSGSGTQKVIDAIKEIKNMVDETTDANGNPTEFAMIILRFQAASNSTQTDANTFTQQFATYFESNYSSSSVLYKPGLTVGDVRGKLLFVLCPTSDGETELTTQSQNAVSGKNFLVIEGLGSLQDKWHKRGYDVTAPYIGVGSSTNTNAMEYKYLLAESSSSTAEPTFPTVPSRGTADYTYQTNQIFSVWAQEWPRVIKEDKKVFVGRNYQWNSYNGNNYLWMHWPESYTTEKLPDVKATFDKAIADKDNTTTVYFNWLCGYYMTDATPCLGNQFTFNSHIYEGKWGTVSGNKAEYAKQINYDFYHYILEKGSGTTGPMGVVMMDYVGNDDPSIYIPQIIVANNFKFQQKKSTDNSSSSKRRSFTTAASSNEIWH